MKLALFYFIREKVKNMGKTSGLDKGGGKRKAPFNSP